MSWGKRASMVYSTNWSLATDGKWLGKRRVLNSSHFLMRGHTSTEAAPQNEPAPTAPVLTSSLQASFLTRHTFLSKWDTPYIYQSIFLPSVHLASLHPPAPAHLPQTLLAQHLHASHVLRLPFLPSPILHLGGGSLSSMVAPLSFSRAGLWWMPPGSLGSPPTIKSTLFFHEEVYSVEGL